MDTLCYRMAELRGTSRMARLSLSYYIAPVTSPPPLHSHLSFRRAHPSNLYTASPSGEEVP